LVKAKEQRDLDKTKKAQDKIDAANAKKEGRKTATEARAAALLARKESSKPTEGRRAKATHIVYTAQGMSSPQSLSIRGKVLSHIVENCPVGEQVSIEELAEACKGHLYGGNVRSYLSKLEEMGHLDFVTIIVDKAEPKTEAAEGQPATGEEDTSNAAAE
jgi:hypothetical protein